MNSRSELIAAQKAVHEGRFQEALPILLRLSEGRSEVVGEAAYCLAILHETGSGAPPSPSEAERHFMLAEKHGYEPAIYQLAGYAFRRGDLDVALGKYQDVATTNPSAAYWAYRILAGQDRGNLSEETIHFLNLAIGQGHLLARKDKLLSDIKGKNGFYKAPMALLLLGRLFLDMRQAVRQRDKSRYT